MHLLLIGCSVILRELSDAVAHSPHVVDVRYLPVGLHDLGRKAMRLHIQEAIDGAEPGAYDYILLGYALCGNGTVGLRSRRTPLVLPRAHDCIGLLMGGDAAFRTYFQAHPGTYFRSAGWVERSAQLREQVSTSGSNTPLAELVARYGREEAEFLFEEFNRYRKFYSHLAFLRTGIEPSPAFIEQAKAESRSKGWDFEVVEGSLRVFGDLLAGRWGESFLIVAPGHEVISTYDERIVEAVPYAGDTGKERSFGQ